MKIALVFPGISEAGFSAERRPLGLGWINHGLCSLSACAKKAGHIVRLIDLRELSGWNDMLDELKAFGPDVVGITMMSVDFDYALESARVVKLYKAGVKVIVGGPHPSIMPEEVARDPNIDHVVAGEGEISFINLLEDIEKGRSREKIVKGEHPDLDKIPFVDRNLFRCRESPIDSFLEKPFVTIIAGRGCIYNCSFCQPAERMIFGRSVRRRSVKNVIEELEALRSAYNFQSLMFHDDCLTEDRGWISEFCEEYRRRRFAKPFVCQSRADIICKNPDMVRLLKRAGLAMFLVGFESGNQRILNLLRKGTTVEMNYKAAGICKKYGVRIWANYMLGMPTETNEEVADTVKMIKAIKPYRPSPAFFTPHPGSNLYDYCEKNGLSLIKSHRDFSRTPTGPKIKGVDYLFLQEALRDSTAKPLSVRLARKVDFLIERRVKHAFRKAYEALKKR